MQCSSFIVFNLENIDKLAMRFLIGLERMQCFNAFTRRLSNRSVEGSPSPSDVVSTLGECGSNI
ncbi:hypothetical protein ACE6H2_003841 [Prunus campanulata]